MVLVLRSSLYQSIISIRDHILIINNIETNEVGTRAQSGELYSVLVHNALFLGQISKLALHVHFGHV